MTKLLRTLLALAALIVIVTFAIANRTPVPVSFAPLPTLVELPVYGVFLLGLVLGGLIGGVALWLSGIPQRFQAWRMRKESRPSRARSRSLRGRSRSAARASRVIRRSARSQLRVRAAREGRTSFCSACPRASPAASAASMLRTAAPRVAA